MVVRIPGRDRREAVVLADHDGTAYMHDRYYLAEGSPGARMAAVHAHEANGVWNALALRLNRQAARRGAGPPSRSDDPDRIPPLTAHTVMRGEVRLDWAPRSTLFNTDGQIFSDVGMPVVLFMEDYDIDRKG